MYICGHFDSAPLARKVFIYYYAYLKSTVPTTMQFKLPIHLFTTVG